MELQLTIDRFVQPNPALLCDMLDPATRDFDDFQPRELGSLATTLRWVIRVVAVIALAGSTYLAWIAFVGGADGGVIGCGESGWVDCDALAKGPWALWQGIPVSQLAVVLYGAILVATLLIEPSCPQPWREWAWHAIISLSMLASFAGLWFIGLMVSPYAEMCSLCLVIHICGLTIACVTLLASPIRRSDQQRQWFGALGAHIGVPAAETRAKQFSEEAAIAPMAAVHWALVALVGVAVLATGQLLERPKTDSVDQSKEASSDERTTPSTSRGGFDPRPQELRPTKPADESAAEKQPSATALPDVSLKSPASSATATEPLPTQDAPSSDEAGPGDPDTATSQPSDQLPATTGQQNAEQPADSPGPTSTPVESSDPSPAGAAEASPRVTPEANPAADSQATPAAESETGPGTDAETTPASGFEANPATTPEAAPAAETEAGRKSDTAGGSRAPSPSAATPPPGPAAATARPPRQLIPVLGDRIRLDTGEQPVLGHPGAEFVVVELFDYTCGRCRDLHRQLAAARTRYGSRLAVMVLPTPLSSECNSFVTDTDPEHRLACHYARLAMAVWRLDRTKFEAFHDWLLRPEGLPEWQSAVTRAAELVGGRELLAAEFTGDPVRRALSSNAFLYRWSGGEALPKLLVGNGVLASGTRSADELSAELETRLGIAPVAARP